MFVWMWEDYFHQKLIFLPCAKFSISLFLLWCIFSGENFGRNDEKMYGVEWQASNINSFIERYVNIRWILTLLFSSENFIRTTRLKFGVKFSKNYEELEIWALESWDQKKHFKLVHGIGVRWEIEEIWIKIKNIQVSAEIYRSLDNKSVWHLGIIFRYPFDLFCFGLFFPFFFIFLGFGMTIFKELSSHVSFFFFIFLFTWEFWILMTSCWPGVDTFRKYHRKQALFE